MTMRIANMQAKTVPELAEACRNGDGEAWEALLDRFERLVYTIACREGLSPEDAADVTQATFEALLSQLSRIRDDGQIEYWLMTVARRQSWRVRNDRQRRYPGSAVTTAETPASTDAAEDVGRRMWLYEGLARLGAPCRDLIVALYFEPRPPSYAELASRLGRPVGSIGPTRARCLSRLRDILGETL